MQCTTIAALEVAVVVEDARSVLHAGLEITVVVSFGPSFGVAFVVTLPLRAGEKVDELCDPLVVCLVREVCSEGAATGIGAGGVDASAARTEDACPS